MIMAPVMPVVPMAVVVVGVVAAINRQWLRDPELLRPIVIVALGGHPAYRLPTDLVVQLVGI